MKWLTGILLLRLQDALFQIVPQGEKAYLKGHTMYDHLGSIQQRWDSSPGDSCACWVAVDYPKAYDSVSHPMLHALFRYICIPTAWVHVLCQVLCGPVLFLVGRGGCSSDNPCQPTISLHPTEIGNNTPNAVVVVQHSIKQGDCFSVVWCGVQSCVCAKVTIPSMLKLRGSTNLRS